MHQVALRRNEELGDELDKLAGSGRFKLLCEEMKKIPTPMAVPLQHSCFAKLTLENAEWAEAQSMTEFVVKMVASTGGC